MHRHPLFAIGACALTLVLADAAIPAQAPAPERVVENIRMELLQLPYYGVFDFLAFKYDKGVVTLMGYAYHPGLKSDAVRAVKRVSGVDEVQDKIEELPPSRADDELRWNIYYAIYRDPFLSRYAPGGGMLWGHDHAFDGPFFAADEGPFTGMEPTGNYPIHIIVKNLHVMLFGVVENESDKTVAEMRAREVPGSLGVENHLIVENSRQSSQR